MSRQVTDLLAILQQLIDEHARLLDAVVAQQQAVKSLKNEAINDQTRRIEACRSRVIQIEQRRRASALQISKLLNLPANLTLRQIAAGFPQQAAAINKLSAELKTAVTAVAHQSHIVSRVSNALLGHLNGAVRAFARAVGQAGTYTKSGVPKVGSRIGVMEAVG